MKDECDYNFISITRCCRAEKRYEIIINTDSEEHYKATQDFAHKLIDHAKPTTNADRIRSMSDEELVEFIKHIKVRAALCKAVKNNDAFEELCSAEWLQMPAEEDDHD